MSFKKDSGVQYKRIKSIMFNFADVVAAGSGIFINMISLPPKARVVGGAITITQAFNSTTSDSFTVGDKGVTNKFKTSFSGQALGVTQLVPTGDVVDVTNDQYVGITWTPGSGTPTTGKGFLDVEYVVSGASDEFVN